MSMILAPNILAAMKKYGIKNAALFNGTTGHLSWIPSAAGNRRKFTIHRKFKRNKLGVNQALFSASTAGTLATLFEVYINASDVMIVYVNGAERLKTTQVFRDVEGFHSFTLRVDTDNATATSKLILEIGLETITSFSVDARAALSGDTSVNATTTHYAGSYLGSAEFTHNVEATHILVDGALHPASDFDVQDTATPNYKATKPAITAWGANGSYLDFSNGANLGSAKADVATQSTVGAGGSVGAASATSTYINRKHRLPNGATITHIGHNATVAQSYNYGVAERASANNFTLVSAVESFLHGGTGMEFKTLATPIVVPDTGDFYIVLSGNLSSPGAYYYASETASRSNSVAATSGSFITTWEDGLYAPQVAYKADRVQWDVNDGVSQVTSTPTNVFTSIDPLQLGSGMSLTNGNRTLISSGTPDQNNAVGTLGFPANSGIVHFEAVLNTNYGFSAAHIGVTGKGTHNFWSTTTNPNTDGHGAVWDSRGFIYHETTNFAYAHTFTSPNRVMVRCDTSNGKVWFGKNGIWNATDTASPGPTPDYTMPYFENVRIELGGYMTGQWTIYVEDADMLYKTVGDKSFCTDNLPAVTGKNINQHFKTVLYTGNGASQSISGLGFQPDFAWLKSRSYIAEHQLYDVVRGATNDLRSNSTAAETTIANSLTSFDVDGFTLGSHANTNQNGSTYASWCASLPNDEVNTSGTISVTWKYNPILGMAVGTYTGNGVGGATLGLPTINGKAPGMAIIKWRDSGATYWVVGHKGIDWHVGTDKYLNLQGTSAVFSGSNPWNNTSPTASTITLGTDGGVNTNTGTYVIYAFWETDLCKIGSYTNNNSADGPFINAGISPVWGLFKSNSLSNWIVWDDKRPGYNGGMLSLNPNLSAVEAAKEIDFVATGAKHRQALDPNYLAFTSLYLMFGQPTGGSNILPANAC